MVKKPLAAGQAARHGYYLAKRARQVDIGRDSEHWSEPNDSECVAILTGQPGVNKNALRCREK